MLSHPPFSPSLKERPPDDDYSMNDCDDDGCSCHIEMPGELNSVLPFQHKVAKRCRHYQCNDCDDSKVEKERDPEYGDMARRDHENHRGVTHKPIRNLFYSIEKK